MNYLSIVACFKNETPYLREWIEFHRLVGVEDFYLYDNASTDNPEAVLKAYIDQGTVKLIRTDMVACQLPCYFHALQAYAQRTRWMAFIDLDEFLFCPNGQDLRQFLREFEKYPALGVSWVVFGSSGHQKKPAGLTIEKYTHCAEPSFELHRNIKSVVNPLQVYCPYFGPHNFMPWNTHIEPVDENHFPLHGPYRHPTQPASVNRIRLNHYFTRSLEEWCLTKRPRGRADFFPEKAGHIRPDEDFAKHDRNEVSDATILRYLPALQQKLE